MDSGEIVLIIVRAFGFPSIAQKPADIEAMHQKSLKDSERMPLAQRLLYVLIVSRMLKKAVQQGRNERRCEEVRTALRVTVRPCNESW